MGPNFSNDDNMNFVLQPWYLLLLALAGLANREQRQMIEYLRERDLKRILAVPSCRWPGSA